MSASFVGVKENLPPYLNKSLTIEDLMTGVSFASSGSGYDPVTSQLSVILFITLSAWMINTFVFEWSMHQIIRSSN